MSSTRDLVEPSPGSIVDRRYLLRREIARGGIGVVFEAEHLVTRAKVALKTLARPALDHLPSHARLMREARILGMIRHPRVVYVQDAGHCPTHGPYMGLEMIDGRPLDGLLATRSVLDIGQAVALVTQVCDALDVVHARSIVHRDIKPANILISHTPIGDQIELIDFGVASIGREDDVIETKLTKAGELLGTVEYMAPEQLMGTAPVGPQADVYACGVVLYECITGDVPFNGSPTAIISSLLARERPKSLRRTRSDVPLELEAVVMKALEVDVSKRFTSVREMSAAILHAVGGVVPELRLLDVCGDKVEHRAGDNIARPGRDTVLETVTAADEPGRRRKFARAPYVAPVRVVGGGGRVLDGRIEDISEGGVLLVSTSGWEPESRVKLRFPLPSSGRVHDFEGIVKWSKSRRMHFAVGIEFVGVGDAIREDIRAYVAALGGGTLCIQET